MSFNLFDIVKVTARFKFQLSFDIANVFHFQCTLTDFGGTPANLKTAIESWLNVVFTPFQSTINADTDPYDLKIDRVIWDSGAGKEVVVENLYLGPWTLSVPPTGAGEALPLQVAAIATLRTSRPKSRGRKFIGPLSETASGTGGTLTSGAQANLATMVANMLLPAERGAAPVLERWSPGILSHYGANDFLQFTSGIGSVIVGTHRSRRIGVGS